MDENEEFEFRHRAEQEAAANAAPPVTPKGHGPLAPQPAKWSEFNPVEALGEGAAQLTSGAVAGVAGGIGYGLTAAGKAIGATDAEPSQVMHDIAEPLTYKPTSKSSQLVERAAKDIFKKPIEGAADLGDQAATAVGKVSPTAETMLREVPAAATAALGVLPAAAGAKSALEAAAAARLPVEGAVKAATDGDIVETLRAAGYKPRPSDVQALKPGEKVSGKFRESLQNPAALKKDLTLENQANTTRLAAEDLGVKDKTSLMEKDYETLRKPHFDKYDEVNAALFKVKPDEDFTNTLQTAADRAGFKATDKPKTTQVISELRRNERRGRLSDDKTKQLEAKADGDAADALEEAMGKRLEALGEDKLLPEYQSARQSLAKIHDYESSTKGGQVDATRMAAIARKSKGRLTGNAKIIADAGEHIPNVARSSRGATGMGSSVKSEGGMVRTAINAGKRAVGKIPGMNVKGDTFQNRNFGREAVGAERDFSGYGKRTPQPATQPATSPQLGAETVDFSATPGVPPAASLGDELTLAPDAVQNPQQLPPAPDMLTADVIPPTSYPGGVDFKPSQFANSELASDLGFAPRPGDGQPYDLEFSNAPFQDFASDHLAGDLGLERRTPTVQGELPVTDLGNFMSRDPYDLTPPPGNAPSVAPEPQQTLADLAEQLGLTLGEPLQMEPPPGAVGKPTPPAAPKKPKAKK
jgi:hypothetical protein